MEIRRGMTLKSKTSKKVVVVKTKAGGMGHWNCACGNKSHKIHEGTLNKFYEEVKGHGQD